MSQTNAQLLADSLGTASTGTTPIGGIILWSGSTESIPTGWALCDGTNGTPNFLDQKSQTWLADFQNVQTETGSSIEWIGIPEDTQRIIIMFWNVSPGSGQDWLVQLGNTVGNFFAGPYAAASTNQTGSADRYDTEGFIINVTSNSAKCSGRMVIERGREENTRLWVATGQVTHGTGGSMRQFAGSFVSSTTVSVFDRIRITSENFTSRCVDDGYMSVLCEAQENSISGTYIMRTS